jgi:hypothetical protein
MFFFGLGKKGPTEKEILDMRIKTLQQEKQDLIIENGKLRHTLQTLSTMNGANNDANLSTIRG